MQYFASFLYSFAIIPLGKKELVVLLLLYFVCPIADIVVCVFLTVPWAGLWSVIVTFPGHTHSF